jgi:ABC-2 type transport system permease protein
LPLLYLLDKTEGGGIPYMLAPIAGIIFLIPCLLVWQIGVRHYRSTGS